MTNKKATQCGDNTSLIYKSYHCNIYIKIKCKMQNDHKFAEWMDRIDVVIC